MEGEVLEAAKTQARWRPRLLGAWAAMAVTRWWMPGCRSWTWKFPTGSQ